jgi:phosphoribosylaminoimidazole-succinocarboxamide synthase
MQTSPPMHDRWIFHENIAARHAFCSIAMIEGLWTASVADYLNLQVVCRGNSAELRRTRARGILIGRFLPTLYSYTSNRAGTIPGTDILRAKISRVFWHHLHSLGVRTCYLAASPEFFLALEETIPPVEVIVKRALVGTPAHIYHGILGRLDRFNQPFVKGQPHPAYVRFDYRNPLTTHTGERLRDEMLPEPLADRMIDTKAAGNLALAVTAAINQRLNTIGLQVLDICLLFDETGTVLCGEISPDNMRIKSFGNDSDFDKDLWRKNRPADEIIARWTFLLSRLEMSDGSD